MHINGWKRDSSKCHCYLHTCILMGESEIVLNAIKQWSRWNHFAFTALYAYSCCTFIRIIVEVQTSEQIWSTSKVIAFFSRTSHKCTFASVLDFLYACRCYYNFAALLLIFTDYKRNWLQYNMAINVFSTFY